MCDMIARIEALAAMPATHDVVTHYADGSSRTYGARNAAAAENYAIGERRKIGRELINRETRATVRVVGVSIHLRSN